MADKNEQIPTAQTQSPADAFATAKQQAWNKYNEASDALKNSAHPTKAQQRAQEQAFAELLDVELQYALYTGNAEGIKILGPLAAQLLKTAKEKQLLLASAAADKNIELNYEQAQKQRELLDTEARKIFDIGASGVQTTVSLVGLVRGIASVVLLIGGDESGSIKEFIQTCDDQIKSAQASVAPMDYKSLEKVNKVIDPSIATKQVEKAAQETIKGIDLDPILTQFKKMSKETQAAMGTESPPSTTPSVAQTKKPQDLMVDTNKAISSISTHEKELGENGTKAAYKALKKSSRIDGDELHLTQKELVDLNAQMITIAGPTAGAKIMEEIKNKATFSVVEETLTPVEKKVVLVSNAVAASGGYTPPEPP